MPNFLSSIVILVGTILGVTLAFTLDAHYHEILVELWDFHPRIVLAVLFGGFGYLVAATFAWEFKKWFDSKLPTIRLGDVVWGSVGFLLGLLLANLFLLPTLLFMNVETVKSIWASNPIVRVIFPVMTIVLPLFFNLFLGYLGTLVFVRKQGEIKSILYPRDEKSGPRRAVLDTSVIIDGRIVDLVETRVFSGPIVVPRFVLNELQLISDHSDELKRKRGRGGLDTLEKLKEMLGERLQISEVDYPGESEVDSKLVQFCLDRHDVLVTCDANLDKVACLRGVDVVNLHSVSKALRPILMPGEEQEIHIVHPGKGEGQGVGYLEDGTMVVVEDGYDAVGEVRRVKITKVHSTQAGRMLFSRLA